MLLSTRFANRLPPTVAALLIALLTPAGAFGHASPCAHTHIDATNSTCNVAGAACVGASGNAGKCTDTGVLVSLKRCRCIRATTCGYEEVAYMSPSPPGLPGPGATVVYSMLADPGNRFVVFYGPNLLTDFGASPTALQGTLTLQFGTFADPANVPVELVAMSLTLDSFTFGGSPTGPNTIGASGTQSLIYDSIARTIRPSGGSGGIALTLTNNRTAGSATTGWFEGELDPGGIARVYASASAAGIDVPMFGPNGMLLLLLPLGVLGAWILATRRRVREA